MNFFTQAQIKRAALLILLLLAGYFVRGQNGQYSLRMSLFEFDCNTNQAYVDVQVSASTPATSFLMTNQNYRISFNKSAAAAVQPMISNSNPNPVNQSVFIEEELDVSFFVSVDGTASFFAPHNLIGSVDSVISYNVILSAGDGYPVNYDSWVSIGRLRFQIVDPDVPLNLVWHSQDPTDFPPTFIGGNTPTGVPYQVTEGVYEDLTIDLSDLCGFSLPIELAYFEGRDMGCAVHLEWETFTETDNDYFLIEKSTDGINFTTIGRIEGQGTTTNSQKYTFVDREVDQENYYQLRQFDFDGTSSLSDRIVVNTACFIGVEGLSISRIHPNPVGDREATIQFYSTLLNQQANIVVTDVSGRVRLLLPISITEGANTLNFDASPLENGMYYVQLVGDGWYSGIQKFIKAR